MILPITVPQFILANLALSPISTPPVEKLPECSIFAAHPCSCPSGTELVTSTTYAQMGANADAIKEIVGNFFDLSWVGISIKETRGCNNELGAVRWIDVPTPQGVYEWHEELVKRQTRSDGSLLFQYQVQNGTYLYYHCDESRWLQLHPVPIQYYAKNGSFAFDTFTFKSEAISPVQTNVSWHVRGCHTGGMQGFHQFFQTVFGQMGKNLTEAGHTEGSYTVPWYEIGENVTTWVNALDPALGGWDEPEELESVDCGSY